MPLSIEQQIIDLADMRVQDEVNRAADLRRSLGLTVEGVSKVIGVSETKLVELESKRHLGWTMLEFAQYKACLEIEANSRPH